MPQGLQHLPLKRDTERVARITYSPCAGAQRETHRNQILTTGTACGRRAKRGARLSKSRFGGGVQTRGRWKQRGDAKGRTGTGTRAKGPGGELREGAGRARCERHGEVRELLRGPGRGEDARRERRRETKELQGLENRRRPSRTAWGNEACGKTASCECTRRREFC